MSCVKKSDVVEELQNLGETAPASWTDLPSPWVGPSSEEHKDRAPRHDNLVEQGQQEEGHAEKFMTNDLNMPITYNETIPQLQKAAPISGLFDSSQLHAIARVILAVVMLFMTPLDCYATLAND